MTTSTGGEAVVATLEAFGVTHVFGIVSIHNIPIIDAVGRSDPVQLVECRHEQGAVHAADGFARASGQIGVCITSTGPGAANAMGGLFEAFYASSPVLMITGQVESDQYGRGRGAVHQAENQLAMLSTVTRRSEHVSRRSDIVPTLVAVMSDMTAGRPRPGRRPSCSAARSDP
jgi:acetolactate synthase-1/2/3 large subunit